MSEKEKFLFEFFELNSIHWDHRRNAAGLRDLPARENVQQNSQIRS